MIRTLLEMRIQRYLDDGAPLPAWLAMLVRRDRRLRQFVDEFHALDDALLLSAAGRRHYLASAAATTPVRQRSLAPPRPHTTHHHSTIAWASCAAAAAVLLLVVLTVAAPRRNREVDTVQTFAHRLTAMPSDVGHLVILAADTSQVRLSRYSPAALLAEDRAAWQSTAHQLLEPLDRPARTVRVWFAKYADLGARIRSQFGKYPTADGAPPVKST